MGRTRTKRHIPLHPVRDRHTRDATTQPITRMQTPAPETNSLCMLAVLRIGDDMDSYSFPLRQQIRRNTDDGTWTLFTGTTFIPHPTWEDAWKHALFIHRIRTDSLA